jgi:hypothetical protein
MASATSSGQSTSWQDCIYNFSDQPMKMDDAAKARDGVRIVKHGDEGPFHEVGLQHLRLDNDTPIHSSHGSSQTALRKIYKQLGHALAPFENALSEILLKMPSRNNPVVSVKIF